ncbi:hypothetical protein [Helicobacter felis]|nr:hypothetical protein [Helicobacter felis]
MGSPSQNLWKILAVVDITAVGIAQENTHPPCPLLFENTLGLLYNFYS